MAESKLHVPVDGPISDVGEVESRTASASIIQNRRHELRKEVQLSFAVTRFGGEPGRPDRFREVGVLCDEDLFAISHALPSIAHPDSIGSGLLNGTDFVFAVDCDADRDGEVC